MEKASLRSGCLISGMHGVLQRPVAVDWRIQDQCLPHRVSMFFSIIPKYYIVVSVILSIIPILKKNLGQVMQASPKPSAAACRAGKAPMERPNSTSCPVSGMGLY